MSEDRTKPHPLYWANHDRNYAGLGARCSIGIRSPRNLCELSGSIAEDDESVSRHATMLTWRHADARRREGYMMALEKVRGAADRTAMSTKRWAYVTAARLAKEAPGEPTP